MAKIGYLFDAAESEHGAADREWMQQFGCVDIIEEQREHEQLRPRWKQLLSALDRGDVLVISKLSQALRGSRELAVFLELCRVKAVRFVSIHDRIDYGGDLFGDTTVSEVLEVIGALPDEAAVLRRATAHALRLRSVGKFKPAKAKMGKEEREKSIVDMYVAGHSIDDIWTVSGFRSRSSVFRILNKYGVQLNRGRFRGPLGPRKKKE